MFGVADIVVGIEGKYLKLGKSKADATDDEAPFVPVGKEEALTRMLLNGCQKRNRRSVTRTSLLANKQAERTYISILPTTPQ